MEKILLEIADLESSIETTDSAQSDLISKLKEDLQALQAAHEKSLGMVHKLKIDGTKVQFLVQKSVWKSLKIQFWSTLAVPFGHRLTHIRM